MYGTQGESQEAFETIALRVKFQISIHFVSVVVFVLRCFTRELLQTSILRNGAKMIISGDPETR